MKNRSWLALVALLLTVLMCGCSKPHYDTSTPQAALDSMYQMIVDGNANELRGVIHIEARDITYDDGVTEASAIQNVVDKTADMLGQLYRVAGKLREKFPDDVARELAAVPAASSSQSQPAAKPQRQGGAILDNLGRFMADPFGLMDQQRQRLTVQDLGDGTAAMLVDGQPAFGFGLQMRNIESGGAGGAVSGGWKIDVPIDLLQNYRPNTRHEWAVAANIMLSMQHSLQAFEDELDRGEFRDLQQAGNRAGRLLGERVFVQAMIYQGMKDKVKEKG